MGTVIRKSPHNTWISEHVRAERAQERILHHQENAARGDVRMCARDEHNMYEGELRFTHEGHIRCARCKANADHKFSVARRETRRALRAVKRQPADPAGVRKLWMKAANSWHERGLCRQPGVDRTLFFTVDGEMGRQAWRRAQAAKAICAECPVLEQCREYGLEAREDFGIWGGLTKVERQQIWATEQRESA